MGTVLKPPPNPVRRLGIGAFVGGGLAMAVGLFPVLVAGETGAWPVAAFGVVAIGYGAWILRMTHAVQLVNTALDRVTRGHLDEAASILDSVSTRSRPLLRVMASQRALIALYRGDAHGAIEHAGRAIDGRYAWLERLNEIVQELHARGIRAVAAAGCNDAVRVREDVQAIQAAPLASTETRARAVLAEAILLFREGRFDEARAILDAKRRLLLDFGDSRQRAIVRAMQRSIAARTTSIYREAARREGPRGDAPLLASWIAAVVPGADAFAPAVGPTASAAEAVGVEALRTEEGLAHAAAAELAVKHPFAGAWKRWGLLWGLLVAMMLLILAVLPAGVPSNTSNESPQAVEESSHPLEGLGVPVLMSGAIVVLVLGYRRSQTRKLSRIERLWADGDEIAAATAFRGMAKNILPGFAATARLRLAQMALRRADFAGALGECDMGLRKVMNDAIARQFLVPQLLSERATALAAVGRHDEATAVVGSISKVNGAYPFLGAAQLRVRLLQALRHDALSSARELARQRTPDLPLPLPVETLADALVATDDDQLQGGKEAQRILHELATDADLRHWFDAVWPAGEALLGRAARRAELPS
ncbi:hypothetical protein LVJ94_29180 [Pendulispora rubella]|uniref:Uncharacterized protein n=1 Tax=Pendulispora rubella TaxID=2741070 RepID=A0ABZ2KR46_9BACT